MALTRATLTQPIIPTGERPRSDVSLAYEKGSRLLHGSMDLEGTFLNRLASKTPVTGGWQMRTRAESLWAWMSMKLTNRCKAQEV